MCSFVDVSKDATEVVMTFLERWPGRAIKFRSVRKLLFGLAARTAGASFAGSKAIAA